jgi:hypothetical protein
VAFRQPPLWFQLRADEADGHDPVLLSCPKEPVARPVPGAVVLERHLAEPRERIPDVRGVVDRQPTPAVRIDVGKRAVRKLRTFLRAERWHARMIARTDLRTAKRPKRNDPPVAVYAEFTSLILRSRTPLLASGARQLNLAAVCKK